MLSATQATTASMEDSRMLFMVETGNWMDDLL